MRNTFYRAVFSCAILISGFQFTACKKDKPAVEAPTTSTTVDAQPAEAPVVIAPDAELTNNVNDAIKDFPGVNATVSNGEVTLTGEIARDRLAMLMQSLHALQPKKINNNLTIK